MRWSVSTFLIQGQQRGSVVAALKALAIKVVLGYPWAPRYFLRDLRKTLQQLEELGWLKRACLERNGRSKPYKLAVERS